ncbi:MAG: hypothetical protein JOZ86_14780 [Candidatus Eremiobacteraeota bacterium]|nr:hypothetical protein [Candidatus Eremiobacteraeota bacterium]
MSGVGNFTISLSFLSGNGVVPGPFVFPPWFNSSSQNALTLAVPGVAGPNAAPGGGCTVAPSGPNTDFALTGWQISGGILNALVTVAATNLYSMSGRGKLYDAFVAFSAALLPLETNGCLTIGGARVLAARVAQALPLTFAETLQFTYGVRSDLRWVDLAPGMMLRVAYGDYAYVAPPTQSGGPRNAYNGGGSAVLTVRRRPDASLGFDAFVDALAPLQVTNAGQQIAGVLDLESQGASGAYGRLIYPPQVDNVTYIASPPDPLRNVAFVFANTPADLATATTNFLKNGTTGGVGSSVFFTGRAAVTPVITVYVNGQSLQVALGTTLADLLATTFTITPSETYTAVPKPFGLFRWVQPSLANVSFGQPNTYSSTSFAFNQTSDISPTTHLSQWDVPLFAGDVITLTLPVAS